MSMLNVEKRNTSLPGILTPDTVYFVKDAYNGVTTYLTDNVGEIVYSTGCVLVSTARTIILSNKILLPSIPYGDIAFRMMRVFDLDGNMTEYDEVSLEIDGITAYAVLNEPHDIIGFGVVTYLTKGGCEWMI